MRKRQRRRLALVAITGAIIGTMLVYNYHADQVKVRGGVFGEELKQIQDELAGLQNKFLSTTLLYEEGDISAGEFRIRTDEHLTDMEMLALRYDRLEPPTQFASSVSLFKLSTEAQLEGDRESALWQETGERAHSIRAGGLYQESFQYELAALADFKAAQTGKNP